MPIDLTEVTSGYNLSVINDNFQTIEEAWDEKLDRLESAQGNSMSQHLDMNNFSILNVGAITEGDSVVEEAPEDGTQYARQNASWVEVEASGGGGTTTEDVYIDYGVKTNDYTVGVTEATPLATDTYLNYTGVVETGVRGNSKRGRFFGGPDGDNEILHSEDFTNASWNKGPAMSIALSATELAPESSGTVYATEATISGSPFDAIMDQNFTTSKYNFASLFVKPNTATGITFLIGDAVGEVYGGSFDLSAKTFTPYPGTELDSEGSIEVLDRGWFLIKIAAKCEAGDGFLAIGLPETANNGDSLYIWGAAANSNGCGIEYAKTTTSATPTGNIFDQLPVSGTMPPAGEDFTIIMDVDQDLEKLDAFNVYRGLLSIEEGTRRIGIGTLSQFSLVIEPTIGILYNDYVGTPVITLPKGKSRVVWRYTNGEHNLYVNGVKGATTVSGGLYDIEEWGDDMFIGGFSTSYGAQCFIKRVGIEHRALTDTEIQNLGSYT